jgi:hypothetical protein
MVPEINFWAVTLAMLSTMVVGLIWYSPKVFGAYWMKLARITPTGTLIDAAKPILITLVVSFISAWVLAGAVFIAWSFYGGSFLVNSIVTGLVLWAGFTAARFITHDAFDNRPRGLTVLNVSHEFVTILVMSLVVGLLPPALNR